jgi:hypothetical protein
MREVKVGRLWHTHVEESFNSWRENGDGDTAKVCAGLLI